MLIESLSKFLSRRPLRSSTKRLTKILTAFLTGLDQNLLILMTLVFRLDRVIDNSSDDGRPVLYHQPLPHLPGFRLRAPSRPSNRILLPLCWHFGAVDFQGLQKSGFARLRKDLRDSLTSIVPTNVFHEKSKVRTAQTRENHHRIFLTGNLLK